MTLNQLDGNVTDGHHACVVTGDVTYIVDRYGNVSPTVRQCTSENHELYLNNKNPRLPFGGYVCARQGGTCRCADVVADLHGSSHLQCKYSPYVIAGAAGDYSLVALASPSAASLISFATNGDLHVGPNGGNLTLNRAGDRGPRLELPLPPGDHE
jgi:hypothetical protein